MLNRHFMTFLKENYCNWCEPRHCLKPCMVRVMPFSSTSGITSILFTNVSVSTSYMSKIFRYCKVRNTVLKSNFILLSPLPFFITSLWVVLSPSSSISLSVPAVGKVTKIRTFNHLWTALLLEDCNNVPIQTSFSSYLQDREWILIDLRDVKYNVMYITSCYHLSPNTDSFCNSFFRDF